MFRVQGQKMQKPVNTLDEALRSEDEGTFSILKNVTTTKKVSLSKFKPICNSAQR